MNHDGVQEAGSLNVVLCVTWSLLLGAGDDPLDEAALHQRFTREPRFLPLGALRLPARVWVFTVGVGQHATVRGLLILQAQTRSTTGHHKRTLRASLCMCYLLLLLLI